MPLWISVVVVVIVVVFGISVVVVISVDVSFIWTVVSWLVIVDAHYCSSEYIMYESGRIWCNLSTWYTLVAVQYDILLCCFYG